MTMERTRFGTWEKLNSLGKGGQGEVFLAQQSSLDLHMFTASIIRSAIDLNLTVDYEQRIQKSKKLIPDIREFASLLDARVGALKILHPIADRAAAEKARGRMAQELSALEKLQHASILRLLDSNPDEGWFVMEYFKRGTLNDHLNRTRGDLLASLQAFRPLVEAVSELHKLGYVHRDIKPDNVFVADDGHLVLGDFGLVIDPTNKDTRLTDTYENVGSRDWMPGWAYGMRMDDVKRDFDVFSLGKVLWSMISGRPVLQLWYYNRPNYDLVQMFPNDPRMDWVNGLFAKCVVEHENQCLLTDAGKLLNEIDKLLDTLKRNGQVPDMSNLRCVICGVGTYHLHAEDGNGDVFGYCSFCGNRQAFAMREKPGWKR